MEFGKIKFRPISFAAMLSAFIGCASNSKFIQANYWEKVDLSVNSDAKIASSDPSPKYPIEAMAEKKSGSVEITLVVDKFGRPKEISIVKESPEGFGFGTSAIHQASKLKFIPAVLNGKRINQRFKRTYNFDFGSKEMSNYIPKEFESIDLTYCTDPQLSLWASRVRKAAYIYADSIASADSSYKTKCFVRFIVNQSGEIFNLEKNDCELGYKSIQKMVRTPSLPAEFKPDTIMATLEFDPNRIK